MAEAKMKNGIRKRGKGFEAKVYTGTDSKGRKQYTSKTFRTLEEAKHWRTQKVKEYQDTGEVFEPTTLTVAEYLEQWLEDRKAKWAPSTHLDYSTNVHKHIAPRIGGLSLARLTPTRVREFYAMAQADGASSRIMHGIHYTLTAALNRAVKEELIRANPCQKVDAPHHKPKEFQPLTPQQVGTFLGVARQERLYALWLILCTTALRRGEACGLRWVDLDLEGGRLSVRQELIVVGGYNVVKEPKTASSMAPVPLLPEVVQALKDWQTVQAVEKATAGPEWEEHGFVFCQPNGKALHPNNLQKRDFKRLLASAGLPTSIRIHDLRHTVATTLFAAGVHPKLASAFLRHARTSTTQDIYTHYVPSVANLALEPIRAHLPKPSTN